MSPREVAEPNQAMSKDEYRSMDGGIPPTVVAMPAPYAPQGQVGYPPAGPPQPPPQRQFAQGFFGIGDVGYCLYSCFCPSCAMGTARHMLDGSDFCVTCFNINPILLRWTTRSAYNIPGNEWEDCLVGTCCPCCTVNQVLHTTKLYGRPHAAVGPEHNYHMYHAIDDSDCLAHCLYATFCLPCAIGSSLQQSMDMPFWMGCCCANFCIARNLQRYHYRLKGDDCLEDCVAPYGVFALTYCVSAFVPCFACCTLPYFISMVMLMTNEAQRRGKTGPYLTPAPGQHNGAVYAAQPQPQPVYVAATVIAEPQATYATAYNPAHVS